MTFIHREIVLANGSRMDYNKAGGRNMKEQEFLDALYQMMNEAGNLEIATLIEEPEELALYVELTDGARYHIQVRSTSLRF